MKKLILNLCVLGVLGGQIQAAADYPDFLT
jgi:hypothetical protein